MKSLDRRERSGPYALHMLGGLSEVLPAIEVERMNYS